MAGQLAKQNQNRASIGRAKSLNGEEDQVEVEMQLNQVILAAVVDK